MRLTSFTDYSLRVLMYLALRPDERVTISEIATAFRISENHLMKVVHFLGKSGILANARGKGGGLALSRAPQAINVGEIVRMTESHSFPAECFDRKNNRCIVTPVCQLKFVLAEAMDAFHAVLDRYTLADVTRNRDRLAKILFVPPAPKKATRAASVS
jgi:Rrf2 family nitric oxide-sensitive transcriptional repressor